MQILKGKPVADEIINDVKVMLKNSQNPFSPHVAIIQVGDLEASNRYVRNKGKKLRELGMGASVIKFPEDITEEDLIRKIQFEIRGVDNIFTSVFVQLPLPKHIDEEKVIQSLPSKMDADGLHYLNLGKLMGGNNDKNIVPCTAQSVMDILDHYEIPLEGKVVGVIGRSNLVGKPVSQLLLQRNATVIQMHSWTENLPALTQQCDVVIVAIGDAKFITKEHIQKGATVIDVGINFDENGKLCGDVDFEEMIDWANITPVPGGVGVCTVANLARNVTKVHQNYRPLGF